MTSALTTTTEKSGYLYLILLGLISIGAGYWFFYQQPNLKETLYRQAFKDNFSAFRSGILLAHYQYIANRHQATDLLERLPQTVNLAFNSKGFPVASNDKEDLLETPQNASDCETIWQNVLAGFIPRLALNKNAPAYWVELNSEQVCIVRDIKLKNMEIRYQASTGEVSLIGLTN